MYLGTYEQALNLETALNKLTTDFVSQARITRQHQLNIRQFERSPTDRGQKVQCYVEHIYKKPALLDCYEVKLWSKVQQNLNENIFKSDSDKLVLLKKVREIFNKKLQNNQIFVQIKGYFWSLEYDTQQGFYYHYFIFFLKTPKIKEFNFKFLLHDTEVRHTNIDCKILFGVGNEGSYTYFGLPVSTQKDQIKIHKKKLQHILFQIYQPL